MSDLFDYNKEWDLGKLKLNTDKKSFKDKYEQEMNQWFTCMYSHF
jgi:hypothetical protein